MIWGMIWGMISRTAYYLLAVVFLFPLSAASADLPEPCAAVALEKSIASASIWANAFGRDHSVGSEVKRLLHEAIEKVSKLKAPTEHPCLNQCASSDQALPQIIISSVPNMTLKTAEATTECESYDKKSQEDPFRVNTVTFTDPDDLNDWVSDFSRGYGDEGEKLYKYCPGNCSPRYRYLVTVSQPAVSEDTRHYHLETIATCGFPRDTDDNQYILKTSYQWKCSQSE